MIFTERAIFRTNDLNDAIRNIKFGDLHTMECSRTNRLNAFIKFKARASDHAIKGVFANDFKASWNFQGSNGLHRSTSSLPDSL